MGLTYLVTSTYHDMGAFQEPCDSLCVGVEEAFLSLGYTITTPVDLDKLGQSALWVWSESDKIRSRQAELTLGSVTLANAYCILRLNRKP
jgi:hypothetical protein